MSTKELTIVTAEKTTAARRPRRCAWTKDCTEPRVKGKKYCADHWAQFPAAVALPKEPIASWYCNPCAKTIPAEEVHLAAWNSPHGDEAHTACGSGDIDLIEPNADATACGNRYQRPGGAQRDDRIVKCALPANHLGDHEEEPGGNTWPNAAAVRVPRDLLDLQVGLKTELAVQLGSDFHASLASRIRERQAGPTCPICEHGTWLHIGEPSRCCVQVDEGSCGCETTFDEAKATVTVTLCDLRHRFERLDRISFERGQLSVLRELDKNAGAR